MTPGSYKSPLETPHEKRWESLHHLNSGSPREATVLAPPETLDTHDEGGPKGAFDVTNPSANGTPVAVGWFTHYYAHAGDERPESTFKLRGPIRSHEVVSFHAEVAPHCIVFP